MRGNIFTTISNTTIKLSKKRYPPKINVLRVYLFLIIALRLLPQAVLLQVTKDVQM